MLDHGSKGKPKVRTPVDPKGPVNLEKCTTSRCGPIAILNIRSGAVPLSTNTTVAGSVNFRKVNDEEGVNEGGGGGIAAGGPGGEYGEFGGLPEPVPFDSAVPFINSSAAEEILDINVALPANFGSRFPMREFDSFEVGPFPNVYQEGKTFYQVSDVNSRDVWWSREMPNPENWRDRSVVFPEWNRGTMLEKLTIPSVQRLIGYECTAAPQGPYRDERTQ